MGLAIKLRIPFELFSGPVLAGLSKNPEAGDHELFGVTYHPIRDLPAQISFVFDNSDGGRLVEVERRDGGIVLDSLCTWRAVGDYETFGRLLAVVRAWFIPDMCVSDDYQVYTSVERALAPMLLVSPGRCEALERIVVSDLRARTDWAQQDVAFQMLDRFWGAWRQLSSEAPGPPVGEGGLARWWQLAMAELRGTVDSLPEAEADELRDLSTSALLFTTGQTARYLDGQGIRTISDLLDSKIPPNSPGDSWRGIPTAARTEEAIDLEQNLRFLIHHVWPLLSERERSHLRAPGA